MMQAANLTTDRPTPQALINAIGDRDGIDAQSLADIFIEQGHSPYEVQRAIQNALEKGVLELGSKLRLTVPRHAAMPSVSLRPHHSRLSAPLTAIGYAPNAAGVPNVQDGTPGAFSGRPEERRGG